MLSELLAASLPRFAVHKVVLAPADWSSWLGETCSANGWSHVSSPLVWRELVDRGGKGLYVGGVEEFERYAAHYYDVAPSTDAGSEESISMENASSLASEQLLKQSTLAVKPLTVAISNAGSPVAYHLAHLLATGAVFDSACRLQVNLLDTPDQLSTLQGVAMEMEDLASPLLSAVNVSLSPEEAFASCDLVFLLPPPPSSSATLHSAALLYHSYASALNACTADTINLKVIVAGKFANTGAAIIARALPEKSVVAAPCLAEEQAKAVVSRRLGLKCSRNVSRVAVRGRTEGGVADLSHTRVSSYPGAITGPAPFTLPLSRCVYEPGWVEGEFPKLLEARMGASCSLAEAVALGKLAAEWRRGGACSSSEWRSLGLPGEGGVVCSQPAQLVGGAWKGVPELAVSEPLKGILAGQFSSLQAELNSALLLIGESRDPNAMTSLNI